jgi:hypothetical protein
MATQAKVTTHDRLIELNAQFFLAKLLGESGELAEARSQIARITSGIKGRREVRSRYLRRMDRYTNTPMDYHCVKRAVAETTKDIADLMRNK